jgi:Cytochrome P450
MSLYPEVQKKAQAEIDAVIGPNRLPDFHDRPSLPYINAIVKESSRWNLVLPLGRPCCHCHCYYILTSSKGSPHMSTFNDEYNGFYIPKGTIMMGNAWLVLRPLKPIFCPKSIYYLGRYCKTLKLSTTPRNSSLNDILRMGNSTPM